MASWLMRMDASSGKSVLSRFAICSGLHAFAHRRSPRCGLLRPVYGFVLGHVLRAPGCRPGDEPDRTGVPARTCATAGWQPASPSWAGGPPDPPSIARPKPGSQASRSGSRRCDATHVRSSTGFDPVHARSAGHPYPAPGAERSALAHRRTDTDLTPARARVFASHHHGETSDSRPLATHRPQPPPPGRRGRSR